MDSSSAPVLVSHSPFTWLSAHEMVESLEVAQGDYSLSTWVLDGDGYIREKRLRAENSDSVTFIERFEYAGREMRHWQGRVAAADCFYIGGRLDSVHIVNSDSEDAETYYFEIRYDASGRLSQVDRVTPLPDSFQSPNKRWDFTYGEAGAASIETSYPNGTAAPRVANLTLADDRLIEVQSRLRSSSGSDVQHIERFLYPTGNALLQRSPHRLDQSGGGVDAIDLLGRRWRPKAGVTVGWARIRATGAHPDPAP